MLKTSLLLTALLLPFTVTACQSGPEANGAPVVLSVRMDDPNYSDLDKTSFTVTLKDNWGIDRVEFYFNSSYVGSVRQAPYTLVVGRAGWSCGNLSVRAYNTAGGVGFGFTSTGCLD